MKNFFLAIIIIFMGSCGGSAVSKKLEGSDSLVITFNVPNTDSIINIVSATEKKAIRKLTGFLEGKKMEESKCGFDGNMIFYKKGKILQKIIFQFKEQGCRRFLFDLDNKVMAASMSNEATSFFENLAAGNPTY